MKVNKHKTTEIIITGPAAKEAFKTFVAEKKERSREQLEALKQYASKLKKPTL